MSIKGLTSRQHAALSTAATRWDRSLSEIDMRVVGPLIDRGLVDVMRSEVSYYSRRKGWWVTRRVITDVKINESGTRILKGD
jgi:hypothetical protein